MSMDHFTVVGLATWPLNGGEAGVHLTLIQTSLLLFRKSSCSYANQFCIYMRKAERSVSKKSHLQRCIHGHSTKHTTVKWPANINRIQLSESLLLYYFVIILETVSLKIQIRHLLLFFASRGTFEINSNMKCLPAIKCKEIFILGIVYSNALAKKPEN